MEVDPTLVPTSLLAGLIDMADVGEVGGCGELRPSHSGELPRSAEEFRWSLGSGDDDRQEPGDQKNSQRPGLPQGGVDTIFI